MEKNINKLECVKVDEINEMKSGKGSFIKIAGTDYSGFKDKIPKLLKAGDEVNLEFTIDGNYHNIQKLEIVSGTPPAVHESIQDPNKTPLPIQEPAKEFKSADKIVVNDHDNLTAAIMETLNAREFALQQKKEAIEFLDKDWVRELSKALFIEKSRR